MVLNVINLRVFTMVSEHCNPCEATRDVGSVGGVMMQLVSVRLMTGFESPEVREQAWLQIISNWDSMGFPWRDPKNRNLVDNYIITGDIPAAIDSYLFRLNMPMARNLQRHKRWDNTFYTRLYEDPGVAARMSQLDKEFAQFRDQVSEMMQEPVIT
jgi:hypothetical protein